MSAMDERTTLRSTTRAALWRLAGPWWMFLLTGIAWLLASVLILRITTASVATVGVLMGVLFLVGMLDEIFIASVRPSWRWLHIVMGVLFAVGAGWAFAQPYNAFWALASVLGLLLVLRGTLDIITAVATRDINSAWWLGDGGRHPGDLPRLLGLPAVPRGTGGAAAGLGRVVRPVPRHLRDRDRIRAPPRPAPLA